jgi:ABC-2 type transport system permease protein
MMTDVELPGGFKHWSRVLGGFLKMDFVQAIAYPLGFAMAQLTALVPVLIYFFINELLGEPPATVGSDYFTFVVVGLAGFAILGGGLRGFGQRLESALYHGQFEMLLVEPIKWRVLPFAMAQWSLVQGTILGLIVLLAGGLLGAQYTFSRIGAALVVVVLAMIASMTVGSLSASLLLLAKRSNAVLTLYTLAASVLSGVYFPPELLPDWARLFAWVIPHTYAINSLRGVLMESPPEGVLSVSASIIALVVFNLVALPIAVWLFGKSLEEGRKMGMLGAY